MNKKIYQHSLSDVITWLRFPLIFLIILLHSYSVVRIPGNHDTYFKLVYPFSLWLGETGVPGFFFISGFLFFLSRKSYSTKIKTRIHTLVIPYLIWNSAFLILYLIAFAMGFPQEINGNSMANYNLVDYIRLFWDRGSFDKGNFVPLLCPLWYIRNLLIMSILSPLWYYIIRYIREMFLIAVTAWWLMTYHNAFIPQTILFFCLGSYFSIFDINPLEFIYKKKLIITILFTFLSISDMFTHILMDTPFNLQMHRLALIFNIPMLFLIADYCIEHGYTNNMLPKATFIVFCIHYPIIVIIRKITILFFSDVSDELHVLYYFTCIVITTVLSLIFYTIMNRFSPNTILLLSGNR